MSKYPCPCKDCTPPKRCATCHSTCKEYLKWRGNNIKKQYFKRKKQDERRILADG